MAAKDRVSAAALPPGYCTALYLKGYALIELTRWGEAEQRYQAALALNANDQKVQNELRYITTERAKATDGKTP